LLASSGSDWNQRISTLSNKIHDLKKEISEEIVQSCVDFMPMMSDLQDIKKKMDSVQTDAHHLTTSIDDIDNSKLDESSEELNVLTTKHTKVMELVKSLHKLYQIHFYLESNELSLEKSEFMDACQRINDITKVLDTFSDQGFLDSKVFCAIKNELIIRKETLLFGIINSWQSVISWSSEYENDKLTITRMEMNNEKSCEEKLVNLVTCMHVSGVLANKLSLLAEQCFDLFISPVVTDPSNYEVIISECPEGSSLEFLNKRSKDTLVQAIKGNEEENWENKISVMKEALDKVVQILKFLNKNLLHVTADKHPLMKSFARTIDHTICRLVIDNLLEDSVPDNRNQLLQYDQVVELITSFEKELVELRFFNNENQSLMNFVTNIHSHFAIRRSTIIMKKSRNIIDKDMLNAIDNEDASCSAIDQQLSRQLAKLTSSDNHVINSESNQESAVDLPKFKISANMKELVDLIRDTLEEARLSEPDCSLRLFHTTQNIVEVYIATAPLLENDLGDLPQAAAIMHNNCWYLCHQLLKFGNTMTSESKDGLKISYVDQITQIRELSLEWFLSLLRKQRKHLFECVEPLELVVRDPEQEKYPAAERCIKQILLQIHHLRKVWFGVLPHEALRRSLSILADAAIGKFVDAICGVEDLVSSASDQLQMACALLQQKLPLALRLPGDDKNDLQWRKLLTKWDRVEELKVLMSSSLQDIVDRWSEGKGPLAENFTIVEVKNLIRALYQNTEYRANAISKIRK